MINKERLVERFIEMIKIDSPSYYERDFRDYLINYFKGEKYSIYTDEVGEEFGGNSGNLLVYIKGDSSKEPICLMAHMDTVSPGNGIEAIIEDGIIRSKGKTILGADDKAGIAAIIEAVKHVEEENINHPDIYLFFTVCEEDGMLGVKLFDTDKLPCKNIVVIDATGPAGIIAFEAPASYSFQVKFKGKSAHAGIEPEKGINAVYIAADAISNMKLGRIDEETTANIGRIEGGGPSNIVTDKVIFKGEVRSHKIEKLESQLKNIEEECRRAAEKFGGEFEIEISKDYPVLKLDKNSYIYRKCVEAFKEENINPLSVKIGGGSDANVLAGKGFDCAIISVGMENAHTLDESLSIEDMYITTKVLGNIISG